MSEVSVVIPTRNRSRFLAETIESARAAGSNVEVIVVDDASDDDTPRVCEQIPGIRYLRFDKRQGQAIARSAGVLASSREFVAFLDDDDLRLPGTIDLQLQALKEAPEAALIYGRVVYGDTQRRLPTGNVLPLQCPQGDVFWELLTGNFILMNSVVARRACVIESGLFRTGFEGTEDWALWIKMSEQFQFRAIEDVVAIYRFGSPSSAQLTSDRVLSFREALKAQEFGLQLDRARAASAAERARVRRSLRGLIYDVLVYEAGGALADGDKVRARDYLNYAMSLYPFRARAFWWTLRCLLQRPQARVIKPADA